MLPRSSLLAPFKVLRRTVRDRLVQRDGARLLHLWGSVLVVGAIAWMWSGQPSSRANAPQARTFNAQAPLTPPQMRTTLDGQRPLDTTTLERTIHPAPFMTPADETGAGMPPPGVWGTQPAQPDEVYRTMQDQAERAVRVWSDRSGLLGVDVQVSPTGIRHDMTWCQMVWDQGADRALAEAYGTTPSIACDAMLRNAVQRYPVLARQAVMRGVSLP